MAFDRRRDYFIEWDKTEQLRVRNHLRPGFRQRQQVQSSGRKRKLTDRKGGIICTRSDLSEPETWEAP